MTKKDKMTPAIFISIFISSLSILISITSFVIFNCINQDSTLTEKQNNINEEIVAEAHCTDHFQFIYK